MQTDTQRTASQQTIDAIELLMSQGQLAQAIEKAIATLKQFPNSFYLWNILGISAAQLGKLDLAKNAFEVSTKINKQFLDGYNNLGNILRTQQKFDEAVDHVVSTVLKA